MGRRRIEDLVEDASIRWPGSHSPEVAPEETMLKEGAS
jgi:hypothetical protein